MISSKKKVNDIASLTDYWKVRQVQSSMSLAYPPESQQNTGSRTMNQNSTFYENPRESHMDSTTTTGLFPEDQEKIGKAGDGQAHKDQPEGRTFRGRKVHAMNFNWLQQSRAQRLRQAELQRVLNKRTIASKNMKENSEQKIMAKKLLNSTFDMEDAPLDYSQSHLSVLNTNIAQAGAKIITDRLNAQSVPPAASQSHEESISIEDLAGAGRKKASHKTES